VKAHTCYHCKLWVEEGEAHDCWTTTEAALTRDLPEDLRDAWDRIRETAVEFGEQRIYASGTAIMFSRASCYFFVRPKKKFLEVVVFLGRSVRAPQVHRVERKSKTKLAHIVHVHHRDEVEAPLTGWLQDAYNFCGDPASHAAKRGALATSPSSRTRKRNQPSKAAKARSAKTRQRRGGMDK